MNILIDNLPNTVTIGGVEFDINSDYRTSILFEILMTNDEATDEEIIKRTLDLYYPSIPDDIEEAIEKIKWFFGGYENKSNITNIKESKGSINSKRVYSYEYDYEYIYSAFLSQYGIDLQYETELHWWKFKALFLSLSKDNKIVEIMSYRSMDLSKIEDKQQKKYYKDTQALYAIPESKKTVEKLNEIEEALLRGESVDHLLSK